MLILLLLVSCGGDSDSSSTISYRHFNLPYSSYGERNARSVKAFLKPGQNGLVGPELKPVIPDRPPPELLVRADLIDSLSVPAYNGDRVTVQYVGYVYGSKKKFASSWEEGKPFTFTLGKGEVIRGWEQGLHRIEVGDRRELVVPPKYVTGGSRMPYLPSGATLVFVLEALAIDA